MRLSLYSDNNEEECREACFRPLTEFATPTTKRDWFYDEQIATDSSQIKSSSSPIPMQNGSGRSEYSTLNVPLDDDFGHHQPAQVSLMQGQQQQSIYHHQHQQSQMIYQQETMNCIEEQMPMQQRQISQLSQIHQQPMEDSYNYSSQQQSQQPFQRPPPQQQEWGELRPESGMQIRPDSQMQMRPDSQMQMRPDSQMQSQADCNIQIHNQCQQPAGYHQQYFQGQQQSYNEIPSTDKNFTQLSMQQRSQMTYKQHQYGNVATNSQYMSAAVNDQQSHFITVSTSQQPGGAYQAYPSESGQQRLLSGMGQIEMIAIDPSPSQQQIGYNITPQLASKKMPTQQQPQLALQQATNQRQRKPVPQQQQQQQQVLIQPGQMNNGQPIQQISGQFVQNQSIALKPKNRRPARKAPTLADITAKFTQLAGVRMPTQESNDEFIKVMLALQTNPNASADVRMELSLRLDRLLAEADVSQKPTSTMSQTSDTKKPANRRRKLANSAQLTIEAQPPGYVPCASGYPIQSSSQINASQMNGPQTIILESMYQTTSGSTYTQMPIQQTQPYAIVDQQSTSMDQYVKKPVRKRPAKKPVNQVQQSQQIVQTANIPAVVQTTANQIGQQILICAQSGTTAMQNVPVMISYETICTTPGTGGQQIVLQYQPMPATTQVQQPMMETPKQLAEKIRKSRVSRKNRVAKLFDVLQKKLMNTDYITPFRDVADAADRLIPFSLNYEPNYNDEFLEKIDHETLRRFVHLDNRFAQIDNRMRRIYIREAMGEHERDHELNMLLYLDGEYERRRFEQDKVEAKKDLDSFLRESEIIRAAVDDSELKAKKQQLQAPKQLANSNAPSYGTYEYNDFDEEAFTRVNITPLTSPAKSKTATNRRLERSKYLYASDLEDSDEDDDEEEEEKASNTQRDKPSSVTELIDLNAIDTIDAEQEEIRLAETPDPETIAANEQTEAIDKALELLPHDLENVIPSIFAMPDASKDSLSFDLQLGLQHQSNFQQTPPSSTQSHHQQSSTIPMVPLISLNRQMINSTSSSFPSNIPPNSSINAIPLSHRPAVPPSFDQNFLSVKASPSQQKIVDLQQQQMPMNFQHLSPTIQAKQMPMSEDAISSGPEVSHHATQQSFVLSPSKHQKKQQEQQQRPQAAFNQPQKASLFNEMPSRVPLHLNQPQQVTTQQPSPASIMKSPASIMKSPASIMKSPASIMKSPASIMKSPPVSKAQPLTSSNINDKFETPQFSGVVGSKGPKLKPINSTKNSSVNELLKSPLLNASILKPSTSLDSAVATTMVGQIEKTPPKPLEPPGAFDDPQLLKSYQQQQSASNQPSLKQRLLQQKHVTPDVLTNSQASSQAKATLASSTTSSTLSSSKHEANAPSQPTTTQVNQTELASVSQTERLRLLNKMNEKLQERKSSYKFQPSQPSCQASVPALPTHAKSSEKTNSSKKSTDKTSSTRQTKTTSLATTSQTHQSLKHKMNDKRPPSSFSSATFEDLDDTMLPKYQKIAQLTSPTPLDVASSSRASAICRPSPSGNSALPVRLRFKVQSTANGDSGYSNLQNQPGTPKSAVNLEHLLTTNEALLTRTSSNAASENEEFTKDMDEKVSKRQRKEEKKLRKEQKKLEKQKRKDAELMQPLTLDEKPTLKLKIRLGNKEVVERQLEPATLTAEAPKQPCRDEPPMEKREKLTLSFKNLKRLREEAEPEPIKKLRLDDKPPKLVAQQQIVSEPKVPRIKIKFGSDGNKVVETPKSSENKPTTKPSSANEVKFKTPKMKKTPEVLMIRKSSVATPPTLPVSGSPKSLSTKVSARAQPTFSLKSISSLTKLQQSATVGSQLTTTSASTKAQPTLTSNFMSALPLISTVNTSMTKSTTPSKPALRPIMSSGIEPQFSDDELDDPESELLKQKTSKLVSSLTKSR